MLQEPITATEHDARKQLFRFFDAYPSFRYMAQRENVVDQWEKKLVGLNLFFLDQVITAVEAGTLEPTSGKQQWDRAIYNIVSAVKDRASRERERQEQNEKYRRRTTIGSGTRLRECVDAARALPPAQHQPEPLRAEILQKIDELVKYDRGGKRPQWLHQSDA